MKVNRNPMDPLMILEVSGKIMGGPDHDRFKEEITDLVENGYKDIILDFSGVPWINSTGLGILISGYTTLKRNNGEMKLLNVSDRIESIFIVTKLYSVFDSYKDEDEAVQSFATTTE